MASIPGYCPWATNNSFLLTLTTRPRYSPSPATCPRRRCHRCDRRPERRRRRQHAYERWGDHPHTRGHTRGAKQVQSARPKGVGQGGGKGELRGE
eukprot:scaffold30074_cov57-Phaeocystis_antarctica.AAC.5